MASRKILVVDDSRTSLLLHATILRKQAYTVVTAQDAEEGLARALSEKPDVVLMDAAMPGTNGLEAIRRLRSRPATRHIPVVLALTRGGDAVETAIRSGCSACVIKPVDAVVLLAAVKSCLQRGDARPLLARGAAGVQKPSKEPPLGHDPRGPVGRPVGRAGGGAHSPAGPAGLLRRRHGAWRVPQSSLHPAEGWNGPKRGSAPSLQICGWPSSPVKDN